MSTATRFLPLLVMMLALAWMLQLTGAVNQGLNLGIWPPVLLMLATAAAVFNSFVAPLLGHASTTRRDASVVGRALVPIAATGEPPAGGRVSAAMTRPAVQPSEVRSALKR